MAGKRPHGGTGMIGSTSYPVLSKRPKIDGATSHQDPDSYEEEPILVEGRDGPSSPDQEGEKAYDDETTPGLNTPENGQTKWQLSSSNIPPAARKIYCVRRGLRPGFFYEWAGTNGAEKQVSGFHDNLYISFPQGKKASIKPGNLEEVVASALDFMNHGPQSCKYSCRGKCGLDELAQRQQRPPAPKAKDSNVCRNCLQQPPHEVDGDRWRICHACWISDSIQVAIHRSQQKLALCDEQMRVLDLVAKGHNVFFTGAAGTGKSRVLQAAVDLSKRLKLVPRVVAPTGKRPIEFDR